MVTCFQSIDPNNYAKHKFTLEDAPTVSDFVQQQGFTKVWLCPTIVSNSTFKTPAYLGGIECAAYNIPELICNKKVRKHFRESGFDCIIWENDLVEIDEQLEVDLSEVVVDADTE